MLMAAKERPGVPPTEVSAKAKRRSFTAKYKLRIVLEADACEKPGELAALLRREGLYSSHLMEWRAARKRGELEGLAPKKRGPKARERDERDERIAAQEKEIAKLRARAEHAEALVALQKKVAELLGTPLPEKDDKR
jgi:transposase-like protein